MSGDVHHGGDVTIIRASQRHQRFGQFRAIFIFQPQVALRNLVDRIRGDLNGPLDNLGSGVDPCLCALHLEQLFGHLGAVRKFNEVHSENLDTSDGRAFLQQLAHFDGN